MWRHAMIGWTCAAILAIVPATALSSPAPRVTAHASHFKFVVARSIEHPVFGVRLPSRLLPNVRYAGTVTTQTFNAFMTSLTFDTNTNTIFFLSNSSFEELLASGQTSQIADLSSFGSASTVVWDENTQLFYVSVGSEIVAVTESGTVTVLAGSSTRGTQDGQGPNAQFQGPSGMGLDPVGHYLYVADSDRLRRVDEAGNVLTVGPTGVFGGGVFSSPPFSVAFDTRSGDVAILDQNSDDILKFLPATQSYRTLAGTCVQQPNGPGCIGLHEDGRGLHGLFAMTGSPQTSIVYDQRANAFYLPDSFNNDVRKIDAKGNVTTLAGNGTQALVDGVGLLAEFLDPTCVGLDPVNNTLLVCDTFGNLRIVTTTGQPAPLPPGFLALVPTPSVLSAPSGIARATDGSLWFSESGTGLMGVMSATGKMHEYALPGGFFNPHGAAADPSGSIWFGDFDLSFTHAYLGMVGSRGSVAETFLSGGCNFESSPPAYFTPDGARGVWLFNPCASSLVHRDTHGRLAQFVIPGASGLAMGNGFIWVGQYNQLQQYAFDGTLLATFAGVGAGSGMLLVPDGDIWYINDANSGEVGDFNPGTGSTIVYQLPSCGCTRHIGDLTLAGDGAFWFTEAESDPNRGYPGGMGRLTTDGTYTEYHTYEPRSKPAGATVDANGRVWFADAGANKLGYVP